MSIEILAPAGNAESFKAAINAGADAIYIGLNEFSARKNAENFSIENVRDYIKRAHLFGVKVYVAVNTLVKNSELDTFFDVIGKAYVAGADAFILQDMLLGKIIKANYPDIVLHLSTQAGVCNTYGAYLAKEYGFDRVILARETPISDIEKIAKIIETEVFVQGALCSSFSGHCYMSSFIGGLSGNRGYCKQPCRKKYTYKGEGFKPFTGYNLSLSDLCLKDYVKELAEAGVKSFKIEGRMRSPEYVYSAVKVYKECLDSKAVDNGKTFKNLKKSFNRGEYTNGYFNGVASDIISSKTQGNIGDFCGKIVSIDSGVAKVKTNSSFTRDDGFKVLQNGYETGSAAYLRSRGNIAEFSVTKGVSVGDEIRITKDAALSNEVLSLNRALNVEVSLEFKENEVAKCLLTLKGRSVTLYSDAVFPSAGKQPMTEDDLIACFNKVGEYPFSVSFNRIIIENVFAPKSVLNAFRRKCYDALLQALTETEDREYKKILYNSAFTSAVKNDKNIVIISDFSDLDLCFDCIVVLKPTSYLDRENINCFVNRFAEKEKYLYLPPYASEADLAILETDVTGFDGVYTESYYGIYLAEKLNLKFICGTGLNVFNDYDVEALCSYNNLASFVYSKELSLNEISEIKGKGKIFTFGNIQVMDLIYCPFSKKCGSCSKGDVYNLLDEDNRSFSVRRYRLSSCRFEVYNPYSLLSPVIDKDNNLFDFTLFNSNIVNDLLTDLDQPLLKEKLGACTRGNLVRGVK